MDTCASMTAIPERRPARGASVHRRCGPACGALLALGLRAGLTLCACLALCACQSDGGRARAPSSAAHRRGATGNAVIAGVVSFHGTLPPPPQHARPTECPSPAQQPPDPGLLLSPDGGVGGAFVWIKAGLPPGEYAVPQEPVVLGQAACEFSPRVFGLRVGQTLRLAAGDGGAHHVHAWREASPLFDVQLRGGDGSAQRTIGEGAVMARLTCDQHPWARAYAGIVNHPYFAVTAKNGSYTIPSLPGGTFTVEVWQERIGQVNRQVTLDDGVLAVVDFELQTIGAPDARR
jgi:hypothetical protein